MADQTLFDRPNLATPPADNDRTWVTDVSDVTDGVNGTDKRQNISVLRTQGDGQYLTMDNAGTIGPNSGEIHVDLTLASFFRVRSNAAANLLTVANSGAVIVQNNLSITTGDININAGDLIVQAGDITTGNVGPSNLTLQNGNISVLSGNITCSTGNITATAGDVTGENIIASDTSGTSIFSGKVTIGGNHTNTGTDALAQGNNAIVSGNFASAQGSVLEASGNASHAGGLGSGAVRVTAGGLAAFNHSRVSGVYTGNGANGSASAILGGIDNEALGSNSATIGGAELTSDGLNTVVIGGTGRTETADNTVNVPDLVIDGARVSVANLPTSSVGLLSGELWVNPLNQDAVTRVP